MKKPLLRTMRIAAIASALALGLAACATPTTSGAAPAPGATTDAPEFPVKGKTMTMIIPFAPGGLTDLSARVLAPALEAELGIGVDVVNKPGASSQVGLTELSQSKADGYTFGYTLLPTTPNAYLDPKRKAAFDRDSFIGFANYFSTPIVAVTTPDSGITDLDGLVAKAKASPATVAVGTGALGGPADMGRVLLEMSEDIQFANVQFDGGGPTAVALLGGHIDVAFASVPEIQQYVKSGQMVVLGVMTSDRVELLPDAPTFAEQGYDLTMASTGVFSVPAGTPDAVVDRLTEATKKAMADANVVAKSKELGFLLDFMDRDGVTAAWDESDAQITKILGGSSK